MLGFVEMTKQSVQKTLRKILKYGLLEKIWEGKINGGMTRTHASELMMKIPILEPLESSDFQSPER